MMMIIIISIHTRKTCVTFQCCWLDEEVGDHDNCVMTMMMISFVHGFMRNLARTTYNLKLLLVTKTCLLLYSYFEKFIALCKCHISIYPLSNLIFIITASNWKYLQISLKSFLLNYQANLNLIYSSQQDMEYGGEEYKSNISKRLGELPCVLFITQMMIS